MDRYVTGLCLQSSLFLPFASVQFSVYLEQGLRELAQSQSDRLEREMNILQGLTTRASVVKHEGDGSSEEYGLDRIFDSGDVPNRPGGSCFLPRKFVGIDDLPLLDSEDPTKRSGTGNMLSENWPRVSQLVAPGFSLGTGFALGSSHFPVRSEGGAHSMRRESGIDNVTTRETKRPKERKKRQGILPTHAD
jgi:hypothetical protein